MLARVVQSDVRLEVPVPEANWRIDMLFLVGEAHEAWGILREDLSERPVIFEHFSGPPDTAELAGVLLKTVWGVERWLKGHWQTKRAPLGLVLCVGHPAKALEFFGLIGPSQPLGVYRTRESGLEVIVVDVKGLERVPGSGYLRLFDHREQAQRGNHVALWKDPGLSTVTKEQIGRVVMSQRQVFTPLEQELTFDEIKRRALDEGHAQGHAQGQSEEARALAVRVLRRRLEGALPTDLEVALEACDERARLESVVELAVEVASREELISAALGLLRGAR